MKTDIQILFILNVIIAIMLLTIIAMLFFDRKHTGNSTPVTIEEKQ